MILLWKTPRRSRCGIFFCLLLLVFFKEAAADPALAPPFSAASGTTGLEEHLLAIYVNQQDLHETALLLKKNGVLLAGAADIEKWRFTLPAGPAFAYQGQDFYALSAIRGISYRIDEAAQALVIDADPDVLSPTRISGSALQFSTPDPSSLGGFFNYEIFSEYAQQRFRLDSLMEIGAFNGWGVGFTNFLAKDITDRARMIRLDSTWTIDKPEQMTSLRIGDAISSAGAWGRPVRFGGVQWATNFQTQPAFITFPLPNIQGEAVLPSTVDVFVDNNRLLSREVEPGPFTIDNMPTITGLRDMRLVVRDLLGREQIISQPYYASPNLLRQNLQEFSYEIGAIRKNYGTKSNDYGRWFAVGTHRLGFTEHLTGEVHAELLKNQQNFGLGSVFLSPMIGVFNAAIAGSHSEKGLGGLLSLGFQRQTSRLSFGGRAQFASREFSQLGLAPDRPAPKLLSSLYLGYSTQGYGSLGLNHTYQQYRDQSSVSLINGNYNFTFGSDWFVNLSAFSSLNGDNNKGIGLVLGYTFGAQSNASLTTGVQNGAARALMQVQRNLPPGSGIGYRVLAGYDDSERLEAGLALQNDVGTYNLDASRFRGQNNFRASARGGLAIMGGDAFFSRSIDSSFAVVQVPDYPDVRVYAENQLVATTNAWGNALVPALRPYQDNHIRIEQADLPLDAQIDTLSVTASPYFRSGYLLKFPVRRSRGATLQIVLDNGQPLPAGATVQIVGQRQQFPVALQGKVYVTGLAPENKLRIHWHGQSCELEIDFPETEEPLPDLGTFTCHGVTP